MNLYSILLNTAIVLSHLLWLSFVTIIAAINAELVLRRSGLQDQRENLVIEVRNNWRTGWN